MATSRRNPSPIVIGMQPHVTGRIKSPRERTKELLPRRLDAVIGALRALHTLGTEHHELRPQERKRVVARLQEELQGVEAALEGKHGTLVPNILDDD